MAGNLRSRAEGSFEPGEDERQKQGMIRKRDRGRDDMNTERLRIIDRLLRHDAAVPVHEPDRGRLGDGDGAVLAFVLQVNGIAFLFLRHGRARLSSFSVRAGPCIKWALTKPGTRRALNKDMI